MSVTSVYRHIIDDVIKNIKEEFVKEGIAEHILITLQAEWEQKINQTTTMSSEDYSNSAYAPKRTMAPTFGTGQSFDQYQYNETSTPQEYHTPYQPINTPQNAQTPQGAHEYSEYTGRPQSFMPPPATWNTEQEAAHSKPAPKLIKPDPDATTRPRKSGSRGIHQNDGANDDIDLDNVKDKYERAKIVDKKNRTNDKEKANNPS